MVQVDGMVGAIFLCVPTLGAGVLIICAALGGVGVSTLAGDLYLAIFAGGFCYTFGVAPCLSSQD